MFQNVELEAFSAAPATGRKVLTRVPTDFTLRTLRLLGYDAAGNVATRAEMLEIAYVRHRLGGKLIQEVTGEELAEILGDYLGAAHGDGVTNDGVLDLDYAQDQGPGRFVDEILPREAGGPLAIIQNGATTGLGMQGYSSSVLEIEYGTIATLADLKAWAIYDPVNGPPGSHLQTKRVPQSGVGTGWYTLKGIEPQDGRRLRALHIRDTTGTGVIENFRIRIGNQTILEGPPAAWHKDAKKAGRTLQTADYWNHFDLMSANRLGNSLEMPRGADIRLEAYLGTAPTGGVMDVLVQTIENDIG